MTAAIATAPVRAAITRDRWHRYTHAGIVYPGVTSIIKIIDKSDALMAWASRNTAEAALAQLDHLVSLRDTVGPEGVIKALTARSSWKRDEAASIGSDIHGYAERIARGEPFAVLSGPIMARVEAYREWWASSGWRLRLAEALVVNPTVGYGGTLDLLAYDETGRTVLADVKTGQNLYADSIRLQLAAYGDADLIAPQGGPKAWPMPQVERYVVLHVTEEGVRIVDVPVGGPDRQAFVSAVLLSAWHGGCKGTRL